MEYDGEGEKGAKGSWGWGGERGEGGRDGDRKRRLPEAEPEHGDAENADEDGGELEVWRKPRPEQLDRLAMALFESDVFDAAWLDGGDSLPVVALPNGNVCLDLLD